MKKLLIVGGSGFIGLNFGIEAINKGYKVGILDNLTYAAVPNFQDFVPSADFVFQDIRDAHSISSAISGYDVVVNFAAETHNDNSISNPKIFIETNILGTYNLIQSCLEADIHYHHVSTDEVFGDLELSDPATFSEESPYRPSSPYSASKAASDHLVRAWIRTFGLRATLSNCSNNFGPFQNVEKFIPSIVRRVLDDEKPRIYGTGKNVRDWIFVEDHVRGIFDVLELGTFGETYLFGGGMELQNIELAKKILKILGKPEYFYHAVGDRPGHDLRYAVNWSKAQAKLGWAPRPSDFDNRLEETVEWYLHRFQDLNQGGR